MVDFSALNRQLEQFGMQLEGGGGGRRPPDPIERGSGPSHDPAMEARVAVLEEIASSVKATLGELKEGQKDMRKIHDRDFRITFGAIIAVALGLATLMARGFHWL